MGMSFQLSPGVVTREFDLTTIVPQVATSAAAYVGSFQWGPVEQVKTISSEETLNDTFGIPTSGTYLHYFSAKNFLDYSSNLKLVRVVESTALNATVDGTGILVKNLSDWEDNHSGGTNSVGEFSGRYPGALGNNIRVEMVDGTSYSSVESTAIVSAGSGYTTVADNGVAVTFAAPAAGGTTATGTLVVVDDVVTGIIIAAGAAGSGYKTAPAVTIPDPIGGGLAATATSALWSQRGQFRSAPGTSDYVAGKNGTDDEMHIIVLDNTGIITGEAGTVLEKYAFVSKALDAKNDDGTSNYYVDVLRNLSDYIHWMDHVETDWGTSSVGGTDYSALTDVFKSTFTGGISGDEVGNTELMVGWALFANPENVDISLVISGPADATLQSYLIQNIAETRKDCVAVISPQMASVVRNPGSELDAVITERDVLTSSSYGVFDCNWKYQFDAYNNAFRWIPCNADVAGLMARTDVNYDPWFSPAGLSRGSIKNTVKLAWNPDKTARDEMYQKGINSIVTLAAEGTILFGDKTMLSKPSAFGHINVRRLFIVLEKAIAKASQYALFEFNDAFTRARFVQLVEPYLRDVQGRRGVTDFRVVCNETNNTAQVINSNGFVGDIYIQPNQSINYITLNFIATPAGVDFDEVQGQFGSF